MTPVYKDYMAHRSQASSLATPTITLLRTKIHLPPVRTDWIRRSRLLDRLDHGLERALILLSAPAGFGKTTLLTQWLHTCPLPVAWVSLDEHDSQFTIFVAYVTAAIQRALPESCPETAQLLDAFQPPQPDFLSATLMNEISAIPHAFILAIDDYHVITDETIHVFVNGLVAHAPPNLHLVLSTRAEPPLPLWRLRAHNVLLEQRASDLCFTGGEAQAFLASFLGAEPRPEIVEALTEQTEGWIAGLRLAALSLPSAQDPGSLLAALERGGNYAAQEFLFSEVLNRQSAEIQAFLLRASILDRFSGVLCDALGERSASPSHSHSALEQLERLNLFLTRLDEQGEWYRFHQLFQAVLQRELRSRYSPDEFRALHQRASDWFAAQGMIEEALQHALAAEDFVAAAHLIEYQFHSLLNEERWRLLERWLTLLPEWLVQQRPLLLVARAMVHHFKNQLVAIPPLLGQAEALLNAPDCALDESERRATWAMIQALLAQNFYFQARNEDGLQAAQNALKNLPAHADFARAGAITYLALNQHVLGRGDEAVRTLIEALDTGAMSGTGVIRLLLGLCNIHRQNGQLDQLSTAAQRLLAVARKENLLIGVYWGRYYLGCVAYEQNDLDAARDHFLAVSEQRYHAQAAAAYESLMGLALTFQAQGRILEAQETLQDLLTYALESENPTALKTADGLRARLALANGDADRAVAVFDALNGPPAPLTYADPPALIQGRILIAQRDATSQAQARDHLAALRRFAEATHSVGHLHAILAMQAVAEAAVGEREDALVFLRQALLSAQPQGFVRTFVDIGPALVDLLHDLRDGGIAPGYLDRLLSVFAATALPQNRPFVASSAHESMVGAMTEREIEVLHLLEQRYSDKEIAKQLVISSFTVRTHTHNIYNKLAVNDRRAAVVAARALGLLE
jgi:ATP/maltotriose-dependent transcriptional regulator MalT